MGFPLFLLSDGSVCAPSEKCVENTAIPGENQEQTRDPHEFARKRLTTLFLLKSAGSRSAAPLERATWPLVISSDPSTPSEQEQQINSACVPGKCPQKSPRSVSEKSPTNFRQNPHYFMGKGACRTISDKSCQFLTDSGGRKTHLLMYASLPLLWKL